MTKGPFCNRQAEQVGNDAEGDEVTQFTGDLTPLLLSRQYPIELAQRDSLPHQTKFAKVHAAHEASWLAGHCHGSWYIEEMNREPHAGQESDKFAEGGKQTPIFGGENASELTFVIQL